jgi:hypothetical protein
MKKVLSSAVMTAAAVLVFSGSAFAQASDTANLTVTANVNSKAKLTLGAPSITFNDANPDDFAIIDAAEISVEVKARTSSDGEVTLTVLADGDFTSGASDTIGIGNLTWTVTGAGFSGGTSSTASGVTVGSWAGSGERNGTQTYHLANSWDYATGIYTTALTYTLTVQ